jgi:hypothetical protein
MQSTIRMIASDISHMALHYVWRDSGVTDRHGFKLHVDVTDIHLEGQPFISIKQRAELLLAGEYEFISGLHHQTYIYRARGDKRFVYLAQAQNDWDDRLIAIPEIRSARDLEGKRVIVKEDSGCVLGNLKQSLRIAGADLDKIEFVFLEDGERAGRQLVRAVASGQAVAASVDVPFDKQAEKHGLHRLEVPSLPVIHNATICANREWVRDNLDTTRAFLRSMIDAIHFFKTQKSRTCEILERTFAPAIGLEGADEVEHLHAVWSSLLSPKPYPHPLAVWNVYVLDILPDPRANFIGPYEIWDTSHLRSIDDSGYIDELYGGPFEARNPTVNAVI